MFLGNRFHRIASSTDHTSSPIPRCTQLVTIPYEYARSDPFNKNEGFAQSRTLLNQFIGLRVAPSCDMSETNVSLPNHLLKGENDINNVGEVDSQFLQLG